VTKLLSDEEYAILNRNVVSRSLYDNLEHLGVLECIEYGLSEAVLNIKAPHDMNREITLKVLSANGERATITLNVVWEYGPPMPVFWIMLEFGDRYTEVLRPDLCFTSIYISLMVLDGIRFEIPKGGC
jgi:hypothetical protein